MRKVTILNIILLISVLACGDKGDPVVETPLLSMNSLSVIEGNSSNTVYLNLTLSPSSDENIDFLIEARDISAKINEDYSLGQQVISVAAGQISVPIRIEILGDELYEEDEVFKIEVIPPSHSSIQSISAEVEILNDDNSNAVEIPSGGYKSPLNYNGMKLIWSDEFDDSPGSDWVYEIGRGSNGWGNQELQYYTDENHFVKEGHLVIEARNEDRFNSFYTSTRMITKDRFEFKYGRVDIRGALPEGQGIWPAFWMLGANFSDVGWPHCGEVDIMEMIGGKGREKVVHGTVHYDKQGHVYTGDSIKLTSGTFHDQFHVFSIIWDENSIRWLMNDIEYNRFEINTTEREVFNKEFFFIINLAVGGIWPGYPDQSTQFPQHLIVDYIRVFQPE